MAKSYTEVNLEIIASLRTKGYKHIHFILQPTVDSIQAVVEVIPGKQKNTQLNLIPLSGSEILDYFDEPSPMTKYVIDQDFIIEANSV